MNTQFQYKGFVADAAVTSSANQLLSYLRQVSPEDTTIVARTEFDGAEYGCSIDLFFSKHSIYAFTTAGNPVAAIGKAAAKIELQLKN